MPIGKDSITKRVAKTEEVVTPVAEEIKAEIEAKPAAKTEVKKKSPAKSTKVAVNVMGSVSPETTKAVLGHNEGSPVSIVSIGDDMPDYLL